MQFKLLNRNNMQFTKLKFKCTSCNYHSIVPQLQELEFIDALKDLCEKIPLNHYLVYMNVFLIDKPSTSFLNILLKHKKAYHYNRTNIPGIRYNNKRQRNKSKIIFGGQMERFSILRFVAPPTTAEKHVQVSRYLSELISVFLIISCQYTPHPIWLSCSILCY